MSDLAQALRTHAGRLIIIAAKVTVSIGLLYWLFTTLSANSEWPAWAGANFLLLGLCLGTELIKLWVLAKRWQLVTSSLPGGKSPRLTFWRYLSVTWLSQAISQILPAVIGGDGFRIAALRYDSLSLRRATESVVLDRIIGLSGLVILMALGWHRSLGMATLLAGAAALALTIAGATYVLPRRLGLNITGRPAAGFSVLLLLLSVLGHALSVVTFLCAAWALGLDVPSAVAFAAFPAALLFSMLPVAFGGWGVREAAVVYGMSLYGVDKHTALLASLIFGMLQVTVSIPSVVFLFLPQKRVDT